jgi:hypothetical protein
VPDFSIAIADILCYGGASVAGDAWNIGGASSFSAVPFTVVLSSTNNKLALPFRIRDTTLAVERSLVEGGLMLRVVSDSWRRRSSQWTSCWSTCRLFRVYRHKRRQGELKTSVASTELSESRVNQHDFRLPLDPISRSVKRMEGRITQGTGYPLIHLFLAVLTQRGLIGAGPHRILRIELDVQPNE